MSKGSVHNALSRGLLPSAMSRAVGDMEGSSGLERYGETLTPTLNLWTQPEWAYLRREWLLSDDVSQPAVAGEFGIIALVNPPGSGQIAVIESISAWAAAQQFFRIYRSVSTDFTATLALLERGQSRDTRAAVNFNSPGRIQVYRGTDPGVFGTLIDAITTPSGGSNYGRFRDSLPAILTPGNGFGVFSGVVNIAIDVVLGWRERAAFPGELD